MFTFFRRVSMLIALFLSVMSGFFFVPITEAAAPTFTASIQAKNGTTDKILITFSEAVSSTTGVAGVQIVAGDFTVAGTDGLTITNVTHIASTRYAVLTMSANIDLGGAGELTIACAANEIFDDGAANACAQGATDINAAAVDVTAPTVVDNWVLNMNTGTMVLNFSEQMDTTANVDETKITLQESNNTSTAGEFYTLTDSTSAWTDGDTLTITLSATDLNAIKLDTGLGVSAVTSFLEIAAGSLITDALENALDLTNVTDGAAIDATTFTADTTSPTVTSWTLNMATRLLTLNFSEPVDASTLAVTGITIQNAPTKTHGYTLVDSTTASSDGLSIVINLSVTDTAALNADTNFSSVKGDTYLSITAAVIDDMAAQDVTAIADGAALNVATFTPPAISASNNGGGAPVRPTISVCNPGGGGQCVRMYAVEDGSEAYQNYRECLGLQSECLHEWVRAKGYALCGTQSCQTLGVQKESSQSVVEVEEETENVTNATSEVDDTVTSTQDKVVEDTSRSITFSELVAISSPREFSDVSSEDWSKEYVDKVSAAGIMTGYDDGLRLFGKHDEVTREQLVKVGLESFGFSVPDVVSAPPFSDVGVDFWSAPYFERAKQIKAVPALIDGKMMPTLSITRGETIRILVMLSGVDLSGINVDESDFADISSDQDFSRAVIWASQNGIISGYDSSSGARFFGPDDALTREQLAKVVVNLLEFLERS